MILTSLKILTNFNTIASWIGPNQACTFSEVGPTCALDESKNWLLISMSRYSLLVLTLRLFVLGSFSMNSRDCFVCYCKSWICGWHIIRLCLESDPKWRESASVNPRRPFSWSSKRKSRENYCGACFTMMLFSSTVSRVVNEYEDQHFPAQMLDESFQYSLHLNWYCPFVRHAVGTSVGVMVKGKPITFRGIFDTSFPVSPCICDCHERILTSTGRTLQDHPENANEPKPIV